MKKIYEVILVMGCLNKTAPRVKCHYTAAHFKDVIKELAVDLQDENTEVESICCVGIVVKDL